MPKVRVLAAGGAMFVPTVFLFDVKEHIAHCPEAFVPAVDRRTNMPHYVHHRRVVEGPFLRVLSQ